MILTLDLGTSTTKAIVWDPAGPRAEARAPLDTRYPAPDRAEQDPESWWASVTAACAALAQTDPDALAAVEAVSFAAARQTLVPVTADGVPLGPALVWSDRRAGHQAAELADALGGPDEARRRTGAVLDGASVAAKVAWLAEADPARLARARWILTPRDLVLWKTTGEVVTDPTMVFAAGVAEPSGALVPELVAAFADRLPPVVASDDVAGAVTPEAALALGVPAGVAVVTGAGDRACEALGTAASPARPFVAWGTTANLSVPADSFPSPVPPGLSVTAGAAGGWLLEGGLSAAGSLVRWLSSLTGLDPAALLARAADSPPGARGVLALPWPGGARAPWWCGEARAGFLGLSLAHDAGDLARAVIEAVALEVRRCLEATGARPTTLALAGADGPGPLWPDILAAVTGLPALRRRRGEAASAGAALLAGRALGLGLDLDRLDPVVQTVDPDPDAVDRYRRLRPAADAAAAAVVGLAPADGR